ncbi:MAG: hypothetical protein ACI9T9_002076 [Oleiphilaceae bacterium]|jgi:hypothetical protein
MTHEILLTFFQKFLNQDTDTIAKITHFKDDLFIDPETGALVFSLNSLYKLLFYPQILSFSEFKKALYQGSFNQGLQALGGLVRVYQTNGKIADSLYQVNTLDIL